MAVFRDLEAADMAAVLQLCQFREFGAGDTLFVQGSRGDTMLFVVDGRLRVEIEGAQGQRTDVGAVAAGQVVGEMAVLDPAPRMAHVVAATEGAAFELSAAGLRDLRQLAPAAAAAITATIIHDVTARIRHINDRIDQELGNDADGQPKVAAVAAAAQQSPAERSQAPWWARLFRG
jgi:CRP-like cAMP-binding protein